ncbi:MAG: CBS domain-containing protein [Planctomycetota bacterium]|nr:CBS domain-containing protein [Planctomycetota bacterium]
MSQIVKDVMTSNIVSVPHYAAVDVAIDTMLERNVSGVAIVDDFNHLRGVITEFDVLRLYGNNDASTHYATCEQFMTRDVKTVQQDASVAVAANIFRASAIRRLLVLDGERLAGILSRRDILRCIHRQRGEPAKV